jgi:hypothetical protein
MSIATIGLTLVAIGIAVNACVWGFLLLRLCVCDFDMRENAHVVNPHRLLVTLCVVIIIAMLAGWIK